MMGSASGMIGRWGVITSLVLVTAVCARADVTIQNGASILIFPKVVFDSSGLQTGGHPTNTIIQISNKSNSLVFAHCFYVNAVPMDPTQPPNPFTNPAQWQEVDFDIALTRQQPTHWVVSLGRRPGPLAPMCGPTNSSCNDAGFDPGVSAGSFVPPVSDPFTGELKCIEVDSTGAPLNGNHLKGEATLLTTDDNDASKYDAIGILGLNTDSGPNNGDNVLCLGGGVSPLCPTGAEYNACPQTVLFESFAERAAEPVLTALGERSTQVRTQLTLVPCTENFEQQMPTPVTVQFLITNEFESTFSTSTTFTCWGNFYLDDISSAFDVNLLGTQFAQTQMTAVATDSSGNPMSGFVGVAEEFHLDTNVGNTSGTSARARAALNLFGEGVRANSDLITLPELQ